MRNRLRIESTENVVRDAKIFYVADEDDWFGDVDISNCVTGVDVHLHVGEVASVTLHCILVDGRPLIAEVEEVMLKRLAPMARWRRTRRWWWRTTHAIANRKKVP